ncbi:MAG: heme biosynthesis HemY N-terminal domain-containing protein [Anaerolineae bacterium]|jgi:hypothetical protein|nr:heme biosynthesis HemY N-terminal domain-containing protein [Anaerolineae bacterium]MDH7473522.1 hypothetical protein [Anaerolineae bacterium]
MTGNNVTSGDRVQEVQQALSLGWILAEILGRWRQGIQPPRKTKAYDRLSFSSHEVLPGDALNMAAQRVLLLARNLQLTVPQPSAASEVTIASLPDLIDAYMTDPQVHPLPDVETVRSMLEDWGRSVWIALAARSQDLATAFSLGGSLADTYWYMWPPGRTTKRVVRVKETWRDLLARQRTEELISRLRTIEKFLPPNVASALMHSLDRWGIAAELERGRDGRLRVSYRLLFAWRRFSWARQLRYRLKLRKFGSLSGMVISLSEDEERALYRNLTRQAEIWGDLVRGDRQPENYLRPSDWEWINWLSRITYAVAILLGGVLGVVTMSVLLPSLNNLAFGVSTATTRALPQITGKGTVAIHLDPKELSAWFSVIATLSTFLVFVGGVVARFFRTLVGIYDRVRAWFARRRIQARTTITWP